MKHLPEIRRKNNIPETMVSQNDSVWYNYSRKKQEKIGLDLYNESDSIKELL